MLTLYELWRHQWLLAIAHCQNWLLLREDLAGQTILGLNESFSVRRAGEYLSRFEAKDVEALLSVVWTQVSGVVQVGEGIEVGTQAWSVVSCKIRSI